MLYFPVYLISVYLTLIHLQIPTYLTKIYGWLIKSLLHTTLFLIWINLLLFTFSQCNYHKVIFINLVHICLWNDILILLWERAATLFTIELVRYLKSIMANIYETFVHYWYCQWLHSFFFPIWLNSHGPWCKSVLVCICALRHTNLL